MIHVATTFLTTSEQCTPWLKKFGHHYFFVLKVDIDTFHASTAGCIWIVIRGLHRQIFGVNDRVFSSSDNVQRQIFRSR